MGSIETRRLVRTEKNEIFRMISDAGLDVSYFSWIESHDVVSSWGKYLISKLVYEDTEYYFLFDFQHSGWRHYKYSPAPGKPTTEGFSRNWEKQKEHVRSWLVELHKQVDIPNLWETAARQVTSRQQALAGMDNTPFSPDERGLLSDQLLGIKQFMITKQHISDDRHAFVAEQLQYLDEASGRLGRKDWVLLAIGVLGNIVVGAALDPDAALQLFRHAGNALGQILGSGRLLP